ncbi:MAG TPA: M81 family metallopeptidase [Terriglobia bacterium]|nr:M81 family metallopeptidase [Terriglobia bacterium]
MRVAVGGIYHESNTFFSQPMTVERFAEKDLHYGAEILTHWRGTCSEMGGFLEGAERFGFEPVPTIMAWGMPSGALTVEAFETLANELTCRLEAAAPLDGVLLSLHGAMVARSFADADGEILKRTRESVGRNIPLVVTTDYHANFTEEMLRWPDAIVGYDTYPHIDQTERGFEAANILFGMLRGGMRPRMWLARRPLLPHILRQLTESPPMADAIAMAHEFEKKPGIVSITVAAGFSYADVPDAGFSVLAVAREEVDAARNAAEAVADFVWQRRAEFQVSLPGPEEAVRQALAEPCGLTVLVDVGDNLGAGTPGDGTVLLAELLKRRAQGALLLLPDPEAVACSTAAGVRERVRLKVGGKTDQLHGEPVEIEGVVRTLSDGIFRNIGPMRDGVVDDQGRTAVIDTEGVLVVVTERRMPMWNLQQLRALGIEPTHLRIIVVKAAIAFRAAYAPIARRIIEVDTPGLAAADVRRFSYKRLKRPMYPLDSL